MILPTRPFRIKWDPSELAALHKSIALQMDPRDLHMPLASSLSLDVVDRSRRPFKPGWSRHKKTVRLIEANGHSKSIRSSISASGWPLSANVKAASNVVS